jgi:hypothetical protein
MPGLIDSAPKTVPKTVPESAPPVKGALDPILEKIKQKLEASLPPALKEGVERIVVAALKILYSPQTHPAVQQVYEKIAAGQFQPTAIATGLVNLLGMVYQGSKGKMAVPAAYPAGIIILMYVLDDLKRMKGLTVTNALVSETAKLMAKLFVKKFGIQTGAQGPPPAAPPGNPRVLNPDGGV